MNKFTVLAEGFEHLSYPLGRGEAKDKFSFSERKERFMLHRAQSELSAEMALGASDALCEHASLPVGYVAGGEGGIFLVCRRGGKRPLAGEMTGEEKGAFSRFVLMRLAQLHSQGFGCGGLSPDAVEFSGREVRLLDPGRIFAATEADPLFFEAVSTLRSLVSGGFAKKGQLPALAAAYLSHSPACREAVFSYMKGKGLNGRPHHVLADAAAKYAAYF